MSIPGNPGKPPKPPEGLRALVRKREVNKFIMWTPFVMLILTMCSVWCSQYDWYDDVYLYMGNITGYSIITNIFFLWAAYLLRFCTFSKIAIWTLLVSNIMSVVYIAFDYSQTFSYSFDMIILGMGFIIALLYIAKPNKNESHMDV